MRRRGIVIALHWGVVMAVLAMIKGGTSAPALRWAFVGMAAVWLVTMAAGGPLGRPGPKLTGELRALFLPFHLGLYAALAIAAGLNALALLGRVPDLAAWNALLVLFFLAMIHAVFHLWRHTALNDGALRMILPRAWHKYL